MTTRDKVRSVERETYGVFLRRAEQLFRTMNKASGAGDMIAAGINGVQCAIALVDAVTVAYRGNVSAGKSHDEAATLLQNSGAKGAAERVGPFKRVLELKFLLEYDYRAATDQEVADLVERVVLLHRWALSVLPAPAPESSRGARERQ